MQTPSKFKKLVSVELHIQVTISNTDHIYYCNGVTIYTFKLKNYGVKIALLIIRYLVRSAGLEPARVLPHSDLNAARLPIPPRPLAIGIIRGAYRND